MKRDIKILDIFYGNKCNLACNQCDTRSDHIRGKGIDDPEMDNIKESIYLAHKNFNVNIWGVLGGEPLLYLDKVEEIIAYLRTLEPTATVFFPTNGSLLDRKDNMDRVVEMTKKYNLMVQVCNHFPEFVDSSYSEKVLANTEELARRLDLTVPATGGDWWEQVIDMKAGGQEWLAHMDTIGFSYDCLDENDRSWIGDGYGIYYIESPYFKSITKWIDGQPKPFDSDDPKSSYWNSCPSGFCALLKDKKIYKCAALGTLETMLKRYDALDDPAWEKYLGYKALDLTTCTPNNIADMMKNIYCHIDECSMCPKNPVDIRKVEAEVMPKFKKYTDTIDTVNL